MSSVTFAIVWCVQRRSSRVSARIGVRCPCAMSPVTTFQTRFSQR